MEDNDKKRHLETGDCRLLSVYREQESIGTADILSAVQYQFDVRPVGCCGAVGGFDSLNV